MCQISYRKNIMFISINMIFFRRYFIIIFIYDYNNNYNYNNYNNGCYVNGFFTYNCYDTGWNNYNNNLRVSCYADPENPDVDERVLWYANVSGGDGDYEYDWSGSEDLDSSSKNPSITYDDDGTKRAYVTVEDGDGNTADASCSVYVD